MRLSAAASAIILLIAPIAATAQESNEITSAPFAYLKDLSTNTVLLEKNADERIPPASMAKMMTTYVAFDMIRNGQAKLDQKITVRPETWRKWHSQGSTMFLSPNEEVTVAQLLHGIVTLSGNDACVVLAEGLAGTEQAYVEIMNETAQRMGLKNSNYTNTTGWPDPNEYVSPRDLAIVAERTIKDFPKLYEQFYGRKEYTHGTTAAGNPITQPNRNPLLGAVPGADGLKTGHTEAAGYGLTGSAERDGRRLVSVLSGMTSMAERRAEAVSLMEWGFRAFDVVPIAKQGQAIVTAPVHLGAQSTVNLVPASDIKVSVPRADRRKLKLKAVYDTPIMAPIAAGQKIGTLVVQAGDSLHREIPLVSASAVEEAGPIGRIGAAFRQRVFGTPDVSAQ